MSFSPRIKLFCAPPCQQVGQPTNCITRTWHINMQLSNKPWKQNNGEQISSSPTRTTAATQTGIPDLDKLLSSRQLDVSAKKLADFISKRKTDRRTVWQGLPGILSTIFGGGIGNNKHSWLDAIRAGKRPNIRCKSFLFVWGSNVCDVCVVHCYVVLYVVF